MPTDAEGRFTPRPWKRLTGPLFDVIAPDHPADDRPPTEEDREWYADLRTEVANLLVFMAAEVSDNYHSHRGVAFTAPAVRTMREACTRIAEEFLDSELTTDQVNDEMKRMAKQLKVVVYNNQPGPRHNWPMPGFDRLGFDEALEMADDALHGRWPLELLAGGDDDD